MNVRRVAALLRELADELDRDALPDEPVPARARRREVRPPPPNTGGVPDTVRAEAQRNLRRLGLVGTQR